MNILTMKVTDERSVWLRFASSLVASVAIFVGFCFLERSWRMRGLSAGIMATWSVIDLMLSKWRLRNPDASREREQRLRLLWSVALMMVMLLAVFMLA